MCKCAWVLSAIENEPAILSDPARSGAAAGLNVLLEIIQDCLPAAALHFDCIGVLCVKGLLNQYAVSRQRKT